MQKKQEDDIRKLILAEIKKVEALIAEYRELTKPVAPDDAIGRISRMDAINNKSVTEATLRQAEEKFALLNEALKRVKDDDFGLCLRCKNPIPTGRLLLMPQSRYCVNCAR